MGQAKGNILRSLLLVWLILAAGCSILPAGTSPPVTSSPGITSAPPLTAPLTEPGSLPASQPASLPAPVTRPPVPVEVFPAGASVLRGLMGTIRSLDPQRIGLSSEEEVARYLTGSLYVTTADPLTGTAAPLGYHAAGEPLPVPGTALLPSAPSEPDTEPTRFRGFILSLHSGLTWSDGVPITARDYVRSMERLLDPSTASLTARRFTEELPLRGAGAYQLGTAAFSAVGFQALDDLRLEVTLERAMTAEEVMRHLTLPFLVRSAADDYGDLANWQDFPSAGPYELEGFSPGALIRLKRRQDPILVSFHDRYYTWDYLYLRSAESALAALEAFYAGDLDVVPVSGSAYRHLKEDPRLVEEPANTVWGIYVNTATPSAPILQDPDFRKALYWGTDRTDLAVGIFGSYSSYSGFIGPLSLVEKNGKTVGWRKTRESKANVVQANVFDPVKARSHAELALTRFEGDQRVELLIPAEDLQMQAAAELLESGWEELFAGRVDLVIQPVSLAEAYERYRSGSYDMGFGAMGQDLHDPWNSLAVYASDAPDKLDTLASPVFDGLIREALGEAAVDDPARRLELLQIMERTLLEELPLIPLYVSHGAWLIAEDIELAFDEAVPGYGLGLDMARRRP